ncbi:hypothetical protein AB1E33_29010 [Ruegeria sp. 2012CJ15-1]
MAMLVPPYRISVSVQDRITLRIKNKVAVAPGLRASDHQPSAIGKMCVTGAEKIPPPFVVVHHNRELIDLIIALRIATPGKGSTSLLSEKPFKKNNLACRCRRDQSGMDRNNI